MHPSELVTFAALMYISSIYVHCTVHGGHKSHPNFIHCRVYTIVPYSTIIYSTYIHYTATDTEVLRYQAVRHFSNTSQMQSAGKLVRAGTTSSHDHQMVQDKWGILSGYSLDEKEKELRILKNIALYNHGCQKNSLQFTNQIDFPRIKKQRNFQFYG